MFSQLLFLSFILKFSTRLNRSPGLAGIRICHPTVHGGSVWFIRCTVNNSHQEGERHWKCNGETCTVRLNLMNTLSFKTVMGNVFFLFLMTLGKFNWRAFFLRKPLKLIYYLHKLLKLRTHLESRKQVHRIQTVLSPEEGRKTETLLTEWILDISQVAATCGTSIISRPATD